MSHRSRSRFLQFAHSLARRVQFGALILFFLLLPSLPLWADILVTKDGQQIETEGPWEVKGRQVVFTAKSGALSAVRLSDVDLEASDLATNPPPPPPPPPMEPKEKPKPVMVLTNKDVGQAKMEDIEDFSAAFGGALLEMQRAMAYGMAEMSDDPEAAKEEIDAQLKAQQQEMEEGLRDFGEGVGEMMEAVSGVVDRYPELKDMDPDDPNSVRENAGSIRAAAADLRAAADQAQNEQTREMLNSAAAQMEAKLAGI